MTPSKFISEVNHLFSPSYLNSIDNERPYVVASSKLCRKVKAYVKSLFPEAILHGFSGYCECSGFIELDNKFVYVSISDIRYWDNWAEDILIRTADSPKDYHGHRNHRTTVAYMKQDIEKLFEDYTSEQQFRL